MASSSWVWSRIHHHNIIFCANNYKLKAKAKGFSKLLLLFPNSLQFQSSQVCSCSTHQQQDQFIITTSPPQLVASEYADLNLSHNVVKELGYNYINRIRQHVNPLKSSFSKPVQVPDWNQIFRDPELPLMVDIGSGSGRFLLWLAKRNIGVRNYLGLEIRQRLVKRAKLWTDELSLDNVHFIFSNATNSFETLISTYPGPLALVLILCPDPHFKKKHHKRRVVQKPLVHSIVKSLSPGGQVFIQSDVLEVAIDMRDQFEDEAVLRHINEVDSNVLCDSEGWLLKNPMGIRTEREIHAEFEGAKIYRRLYHKSL